VAGVFLKWFGSSLELLSWLGGVRSEELRVGQECLAAVRPSDARIIAISSARLGGLVFAGRGTMFRLAGAFSARENVATVTMKTSHSTGFMGRTPEQIYRRKNSGSNVTSPEPSQQPPATFFRNDYLRNDDSQIS